MLPDYEQLKKEIMEMLTFFLRKRVKHHFPALRVVQQRRIFEGEGSTMVREDGVRDETQMKKISAPISIKYDDIPGLSCPDLLMKLDEVAHELADQQAKHFYETIKECVDKSGRAKNAGGKAFSKEMYLDLMRGITLHFDHDGNPRLPQLHVSPAAYPKIKNVLDQASLDPEFIKAYQQIISEKREEFRVREGSRKLVG